MISFSDSWLLDSADALADARKITNYGRNENSLERTEIATGQRAQRITIMAR